MWSNGNVSWERVVFTFVQSPSGFSPSAVFSVIYQMVKNDENFSDSQCLCYLNTDIIIQIYDIIIQIRKSIWVLHPEQVKGKWISLAKNKRTTKKQKRMKNNFRHCMCNKISHILHVISNASSNVQIHRK